MPKRSQPKGSKNSWPSAPRLLSDLASQFSEFRRTHKRFSSIPEHLRRAALEAQREGVSAGAMRSECGIASSQLKEWAAREGESAPDKAKTSPRKSKSKAKTKPSDIRVLSVVKKPTWSADPEEPTSGATAESQALNDIELRIGVWRVSVRRDDGSDRANFGSSCCQ